MRIERLEIRNYRVFRHAVLSDLPRLAVVVGANGSGKSTLFDVFSFLKDAVAQDVDAAVDKRGGLRELVSRDQAEPIGIKLDLRDSGGRLITYELEIGIGVKQDGYTSVRRAHETKLLRDLVEEGDLPGSLWQQGLFEGARPR